MNDIFDTTSRRSRPVSNGGKPYLSIIIPAYNESERIGRTLGAARDFLAGQEYTSEVIVVDDGSDDATSAIVMEHIRYFPTLSLERLGTNQGKGAAVKAGMQIARGHARLFMDADNSTDITYVAALLPFLREGFDVVVGSRRIAGAVIRTKQSVVREFLGASFRVLVHLLVPLSILDTQNGFKLFSADAADSLFEPLRTKGWSFDVELLLNAKKIGLRIKEVPIVWNNDLRSRLGFRHMMRMLIDCIFIATRRQVESQRPRANIAPQIFKQAQEIV